MAIQWGLDRPDPFQTDILESPSLLGASLRLKWNYGFHQTVDFVLSKSMIGVKMINIKPTKRRKITDSSSRIKRDKWMNG